MNLNRVIKSQTQQTLFYFLTSSNIVFLNSSNTSAKFIKFLVIQVMLFL